MGETKKRIIKALIVIAIFFFLGRTLYQNWDKVPFEALRFNKKLLTLSFVAIVSAFFLNIWGWNLILGKLKGALSFRKATRIFFLSQLSRYLPGKVWLIFGRVYLCKKEGISEAKVAISLILELSLIIMASLLVFLVSLAFPGSLLLKETLLFLVLIPLGLISLHPSILNRVINFGLRRLGKQKVRVNLRYGEVLKLLSLFCLGWVPLGIGVSLLIASIYPISINKFPVITGMFALAWSAGFLSFLAPGGLGVREGILALLLSSFLPSAVAVIVSLTLRLWLILVELFCLGLTCKL